MKNVIVFLLVLFVAPATSVAAIPHFDSIINTGDAREVGYYALARVISEAEAATVGAALPELQANRFITTGCSKRGMAALIACAGDPRIVAEGDYRDSVNCSNIVEPAIAPRP